MTFPKYELYLPSGGIELYPPSVWRNRFSSRGPWRRCLGYLLLVIVWLLSLGHCIFPPCLCALSSSW